MGFSSRAENLAGVSLPDTLHTKANLLVLNGAGIRTKWSFKIYVGGLYLTRKSSNADSIITSDSSMAVRLHFISGLVTPEKLEASIRAGFTTSVGNTPVPLLQNRIETFIRVFTDQVEKGDIYELVYTPGTGTDVVRNGTFLSTTKGHDFKKALFAIWLGENPVHAKLKKSMLGVK